MKIGPDQDMEKIPCSSGSTIIRMVPHLSNTKCPDHLLSLESALSKNKNTTFIKTPKPGPVVPTGGLQVHSDQSFQPGGSFTSQERETSSARSATLEDKS